MTGAAILPHFLFPRPYLSEVFSGDRSFSVHTPAVRMQASVSMEKHTGFLPSHRRIAILS
jgi:hypothetical protein